MIKLQPIAGEAPWQMGKHSKHLGTLTDMMTALDMEYEGKLGPKELACRSTSAKNQLHHIRGYSPNQWSFGGTSGTDLGSHLQNHDHLPHQSAREDLDFEEDLKRMARAREVFIRVDAKKRVHRGLRAQNRKHKEFSTGELVYYYRKKRKKGERKQKIQAAKSGKWYGPARVLFTEKTTRVEREGSASIIWIAHGTYLYRCAPEQLRIVTRDLRSADIEINGPMTPSEITDRSGLSSVDISGEYDDDNDDDFDEDDVIIEGPETENIQENPSKRFRIEGKSNSDLLYQPPSERLGSENRAPETEVESVADQPESDLTDKQKPQHVGGE